MNEPSASSPTRARSEALAFAFALTTLLNAFLLFQVQPLISKFILPWFGGSPAVWTTCLLFFQSLLFGGYAYAHILTRWLRPRPQAAVHLALLALSLTVLPIAPERPAYALEPDRAMQDVLWLLAGSVGLPYFVLSSTGPLVQGWFSQAYPGRSPYRLYALSNFGSLLALVSYPFVVEPAMGAPRQAFVWSGVFALAILVLAASTLSRWSAEAESASTDGAPTTTGEAPTVGDRALWIGLPAFASMMLSATTNEVCQNVAVVPFLWVAPLALYLLSFIIAFDGPRWYVRPAFAVAGVALALAVGCVDILRDVADAFGGRIDFLTMLVLDLGLLFVVCMLCHGELVRKKPDPSHLTEFYLMISAGGAFGGIFVSLVCPAIFSSFVEWTLGVLLSFLLSAIVLGRILGDRKSDSPRTARATWPVAAAGLAAIGVYQIEEDLPLEAARNFYGIVSVYDVDAEEPAEHHYSLTHGTIVHGRQYRHADKRSFALAYYSPESGVGQALSYFVRDPDVHVGAIGLGVGTVAAYAQPGQRFRFYEINPEVKRLAETYFTYLGDCRGDCQIVMGDARLSLEREPDQDFHLLILDAFSGDAVPTHLLTREAFELYARHVRDDGAIAINITNHHLDLAPVVTALAERHGLRITRRFTQADRSRMLFRADWLLLSKNEEFLAAIPPEPPPGLAAARPPLLWTDDYSNLFQLLK